MLCITVHSFRLALIEGIGVLNRRTKILIWCEHKGVAVLRGEVNSARIRRGIK